MQRKWGEKGRGWESGQGAAKISSSVKETEKDAG